jgi:predicted transport protein
MRLYQVNKGKLSKIKEEPFRLEKDLQKLVEDNLETLLGLQLVKSEFAIQDRRFDTLAYNPEDKSFVIIEYKRDKNSSVIDQGYTYLNIILEHKEAAVLELNNQFKKNLSVKNIEWQTTKVIFISSSFTEFQQGALNEGLPIELLEIKKHGTNLLSITPIQKKGDSISMNSIIRKSSVFEKVATEIKTYTENDLLKKASEEIKELYSQFKTAILNLDGQIEVQAKKNYIAFKKNSSNICDIEIWKKQLKIYANAKWGKLEDPKNIFTNVSNLGCWGNGDYRTNVSSNKDLEYIMSVIKQLL